MSVPAQWACGLLMITVGALADWAGYRDLVMFATVAFTIGFRPEDFQPMLGSNGE